MGAGFQVIISGEPTTKSLPGTAGGPAAAELAGAKESEGAKQAPAGGVGG